MSKPLEHYLDQLIAVANKVLQDPLVDHTKSLDVALQELETSYRATPLAFQPGEIQTEYIPFRLLLTPCCGSQLCWVNHRLPSFCPECGKSIFPAIRGGVMLRDHDASLKLKPELV